MPDLLTHSVMPTDGRTEPYILVLYNEGDKAACIQATRAHVLAAATGHSVFYEPSKLPTGGNISVCVFGVPGTLHTINCGWLIAVEIEEMRRSLNRWPNHLRRTGWAVMLTLLGMQLLESAAVHSLARHVARKDGTQGEEVGK